MGSLFNMNAKLLFGLGTLATAGVTTLVSWFSRPDKFLFTAADDYISAKFTNTVLDVKKYLFSRDEMQAMIETSVRKVIHEEYQNIFLSFISSLGDSVFFALNSFKELCVAKPFFVLGASLALYFGYKFKYLFTEYFPNVLKKIELFFFGNSKLDSTEILKKGTLDATHELKELTNLQHKYSKEISEMFLDFSGTLTKKLQETNHLIEQGNNATCQLVMTMKTTQDETSKALETVITNTVTTLHEHRTFILNALDHVQLDLLEKLQTIHETTYNTRRMTVDIVTEVIGNSDGPLIQTNVAKVPYAREVHDQGSGTGNVVHKDQGVATDDVNLVRQNPDIGNVGHQDHTVVTVEDVETNNDVGTVVQGDQNQLDSLRDEYFNSLNQELPSFDRQPFSRNLINDMTLEEVRNIPHPYGLDMTDFSANSVLESFDWSIMYSIENLSMLIIFFGLLFHYCMKKNKFYGIY